MATSEPAGDDALRERAIRNLRRRSGFYRHLVVYLLVNALLVVVWAAGSASFFWPIFTIVGWGIAVAFHAWKVFGTAPSDEARIRAEIDRMRKRS